MTPLLRPEEAAEWLGVTPKRLTDWRYKGEGPDFVRLGHRTIRYRIEDLEAWVTSRVSVSQLSPDTGSGPIPGDA